MRDARETLAGLGLVLGVSAWALAMAVAYAIGTLLTLAAFE